MSWLNEVRATLLRGLQGLTGDKCAIEVLASDLRAADQPPGNPRGGAALVPLLPLPPLPRGTVTTYVALNWLLTAADFVKLTDDDLTLNLSIPPHQVSKNSTGAACCPPNLEPTAGACTPPLQPVVRRRLHNEDGCKASFAHRCIAPTASRQAREIRQELLRRGVPAPPAPQI